jgi:hypothetical protein
MPILCPSPAQALFEMILYHFTLPEHLASIQAKGLIASPGQEDNNEHIGGQSVVWLTEKQDLTLTLEMRKLALRRGLLCGPRYRNLATATVCLKVVIPTSDRKLKHLTTWLKRHPGNFDADDPMLNPGNWFYTGNIAPERITVFKHLPPAVTYWILPTLRERWLNGFENLIPPDLEADLLAARAGPEDYIKAHTR